MTVTQPVPAATNHGAVDRTVVRLTVAGAAGRRRGWWLLVLPAALLALAFAVRAFLGVDHDVAVDVLSGFALGTLLPLVALIAGTGAIAPEIDDGSITYLLAKPVPRGRIVRSKLAVAAVVAVATGALAVLVAGLVMVGLDQGIAIAFGVGAALAAVAYAALFLLLGVVSRHAVVIGLAYVLIWEGLIGGYVSGARTLSVQQWALSVAEAVAEPGVIEADVRLPVSLVLLAVVTLGATWYAVRRLRAFSLTGDQ